MTSEADRIRGQLEKMKTLHEELLKIGINREILEIYIKAKTGLSKHKVKKMLDATDEFYKTLLGDLMADEL